MRMTYKDVIQSAGRINIRTSWVDRMRRPATVTIKVDKNVSDAGSFVLLDGDARDVSNTLSGIAEIAWGMGWRPAGLDTAVCHAIRTHEG